MQRLFFFCKGWWEKITLIIIIIIILQNSRLCYPGWLENKTERMWKEG